MPRILTAAGKPRDTKCPECGSNSRTNTAGMGTKKPEWHCSQCGHHFKEEE